MTLTMSPRLGLPIASVGTDLWPARAGWMDIFGDLDDNVALDIQVANLAARPAAGLRGRYCWVEDTDTLYRDDGVAWFQVWTQGVRLNEIAAPDAALGMASQKISALAPGTVGTDAVNKDQLDAVQNAIAATRLSAFQPPNAHVAMGGFKLTGLAAGAANGDAVRFEQLIKMQGGTGSKTVSATDSDTVTVNYSPAFASTPTLVVCLDNGGSDIPLSYGVSIRAKSASSFTVSLQNSRPVSANIGFSWLAVGV